MSTDKLYNESYQRPKAGEFRYAIVAARFNDFIVNKLLKAALDTLKDAGAKDEQIKVIKVPGAFEIPLACQRLAQSNEYDAIIALGCVIRGDTPHFDYVCAESARGISDVSLKYNLPVIYGILTTDNEAQAQARAGSDLSNNKGADVAMAAMEVLTLYNELKNNSHNA